MDFLVRVFSIARYGGYLILSCLIPSIIFNNCINLGSATREIGSVTLISFLTKDNATSSRVAPGAA